MAICFTAGASNTSILVARQQQLLTRFGVNMEVRP